MTPATAVSTTVVRGVRRESRFEVGPGATLLVCGRDGPSRVPGQGAAGGRGVPGAARRGGVDGRRGGGRRRLDRLPRRGQGPGPHRRAGQGRRHPGGGRRRRRARGGRRHPGHGHPGPHRAASCCSSRLPTSPPSTTPASPSTGRPGSTSACCRPRAASTSRRWRPVIPRRWPGSTSTRSTGCRPTPPPTSWRRAGIDGAGGRADRCHSCRRSTRPTSRPTPTWWRSTPWSSPRRATSSPSTPRSRSTTTPPSGTPSGRRGGRRRSWTPASAGPGRRASTTSVWTAPWGSSATGPAW